MPRVAFRMSKIRIVIHGVSYPVSRHEERNGTVIRMENRSQSLGKAGIAHIEPRRDPIPAVIIFGWLIGYDLIPIHADGDSVLDKASEKTQLPKVPDIAGVTVLHIVIF